MSNVNKRIVVKHDRLLCLNCLGEFKLQFPIEVDDFVEVGEAFNKLHKDCAPAVSRNTPTLDRK